MTDDQDPEAAPPDLASASPMSASPTTAPSTATSPSQSAPIAEVPVEPPPNRHVWSHVFNVVVLVGGSIGLGMMMHELGWANAKEVFEDVGWWAVVIVCLDLLDMAFDAGAISAFLLPSSHRISFWRVFAAQASGRAINIFVPGGVVGEATKVTMLVSCAPKDRVLLSIVLFNLATFYISVAILIIGVPITAYYVDMPHQLAVAVWAGLALMIGLVITVAVIVHRGAIHTAMTTLRGLRIISKERADSWHAKLAELDQNLKHLQSGRVPGAKLALGLLIAERSVAWITTIVVLHAIGVRLHPTLVIGVLSLGVLINWMAAVVPFGLGVQDGSNYAVFEMLGSSGALGFFMTLVNRARSLAIALIGLAIMAFAHTANRTVVRRRHRDYIRRTTGSARVIRG
ncbi:MAG TPA: lysylphosphatidylglycerol synthase transmembrane domain-containing protein [Kofleriaceae bacterium]|nr:lysylphosphatidylglycerol synthase transmembrane domain-containing protein [Kofleriaceae bacterium]